MITDERISAFIRSFETEQSKLLEEIRTEALADNVPIIRRETEALLSFFMEMSMPLRVLEVGCAVGYSALTMLSHLPENAHMDTIENYEPRIIAAKKNFERAEETRVTLHEGDAGEILKSLHGPYDFIFMDAAKAQYITWLPDIVRLLKPRGILLSDNVFSDGDILEPRSAVDRRDRTIHKRMREYLYALTHTEGLTTSIINVGDGVSVTTRKEEVLL